MFSGAMEYFPIFYFFAYVILGVFLLKALGNGIPGIGVYFHLRRGPDGLKFSAGVEIEEKREGD